MPDKKCIATVLALAFLGMAGCAPAWRPSMEFVKSSNHRAPLRLLDYMQTAPDLPRTFLRRSLDAANQSAARYERCPQGQTLTEGLLAATRMDTVAEYLEPTQRARYRRGALWPIEQPNGNAAFFVEFDPPLVRLPETVGPLEEWSQQCTMRYFNRDAVQTRQGRVTRTVAFEGFESVEADGVPYANCARLKVDTKYRIDWGPRIDSTEYLWLAPGVGEVRRIERISGLALLAYFSEAHSYELVSATTDSTEPLPPIRAKSRPVPLRAWSRCAVYLDRVLPKPRLGGLAVEFATGQEQTALARASRSTSEQHQRR